MLMKKEYGKLDEKTKAVYLKKQTTGAALEIIRGIKIATEEEPLKRCWDLLEKAFSTDKADLKKENEFMELKIGPEENLQAFAAKAKRLADQIYKGDYAPIGKKMVLDKIKKNLGKEYLVLVNVDKYQGLEDLLNALKDVEIQAQRIKDAEASKDADIGAKMAKMDLANATMAIDPRRTMSNRGFRGRGFMTTGQRFTPMQEQQGGGCFNCGGLGHLQRDCTSSRGTRGLRGSRGLQRGGMQNMNRQPYCNRCNKPGHWSNECHQCTNCLWWGHYENNCTQRTNMTKRNEPVC